MGRGIANKLYNNLASYMSEHQVEDLTSGFRAVRAEKFKEFIYLLPNGFHTLQRVLWHFLELGIL